MERRLSVSHIQNVYTKKPVSGSWLFVTTSLTAMAFRSVARSLTPLRQALHARKSMLYTRREHTIEHDHH